GQVSLRQLVAGEELVPQLGVNSLPVQEHAGVLAGWLAEHAGARTERGPTAAPFVPRRCRTDRRVAAGASRPARRYARTTYPDVPGPVLSDGSCADRRRQRRWGRWRSAMYPARPRSSARASKQRALRSHDIAAAWLRD